MPRQANIHLTVGNIVPKGDVKETSDVLAVWQEAEQFLKNRKFLVENPVTGKVLAFNASLDAGAVLALLQQAREREGSLDAYRRRHAVDPSLPIDAVLKLKLDLSDQSEESESQHLFYHAATVFFQQLVLGINLGCPGACQLLLSHFSGEGSHRYEAQDYDARAFHDGKCSSVEHEWPKLEKLTFPAVWVWMENAGTSARNTAITPLNKVLIDLLKIAQQRHHYGARTALLVANQLELLLSAHRDEDMIHARERAGLILGKPPESADCFKELYRLKMALVTGAHPVKRPALVYHHAEEEIIDLIKPHNSGVEKAFALTMALLQTLIVKDSQGFQFSESLALKPLPKH